MQLEAEASGLPQQQKRQAVLCSRLSSSQIAETAEAAAQDLAAPQQQRAQQGQQGQRLSISLPPGEQAAPLSAEASGASGASTPPAASTPRAHPLSPASLLSADSSRAPTPGPYGLRHRHTVDLEGAAAYLQSPADPPSAAARRAAWRRSSSSSQLAAAAAAQQQDVAQPPAQQQQAQQQEQQQAQPPPEVVGEELPPTLLEVRLQGVLSSYRQCSLQRAPCTAFACRPAGNTP